MSKYLQTEWVYDLIRLKLISWSKMVISKSITFFYLFSFNSNIIIITFIGLRFIKLSCLFCSRGIDIFTRIFIFTTAGVKGRKKSLRLHLSVVIFFSGPSESMTPHTFSIENWSTAQAVARGRERCCTLLSHMNIQ